MQVELHEHMNTRDQILGDCVSCNLSLMYQFEGKSQEIQFYF